MTQGRWWTLVALVALVLAGSGIRAGVPESSNSKTSPTKKQPTRGSLTQKVYPVGDLVVALNKDSMVGGNMLIRTLVNSVSPKSWSENGGSGTVTYYSQSKTLAVRQTSTVHKQVSNLLKGMAAVQADRQTVAPTSQTCCSDCSSDSCPFKKAPPADNAKQYGHFVMDNLRVNAMGVSCTVKRLRFQYRGDGLDNDVARAALGQESEKKCVELPKALTDLLEKLAEKGECGKSSYSPGTTCPSPCQTGTTGMMTMPALTCPGAPAYGCVPASQPTWEAVQRPCEPKPEKKPESSEEPKSKPEKKCVELPKALTDVLEKLAEKAEIGKTSYSPGTTCPSPCYSGTTGMMQMPPLYVPVSASEEAKPEQLPAPSEEPKCKPAKKSAKPEESKTKDKSIDHF